MNRFAALASKLTGVNLRTGTYGFNGYWLVAVLILPNIEALLALGSREVFTVNKEALIYHRSQKLLGSLVVHICHVKAGLVVAGSEVLRSPSIRRLPRDERTPDGLPPSELLPCLERSERAGVRLPLC